MQIRRDTGGASSFQGNVRLSVSKSTEAKEKPGFAFYLVLTSLLLEFGRPQDIIPGLKLIPLPSMVDLLIGLSVVMSGKFSLAHKQTRLWVALLILMALHVPIATNNYWALMVFKDMVLYFCLYLGITSYVLTALTN